MGEVPRYREWKDRKSSKWVETGRVTHPRSDVGEMYSKQLKYWYLSILQDLRKYTFILTPSLSYYFSGVLFLLSNDSTSPSVVPVTCSVETHPKDKSDVTGASVPASYPSTNP